jgi:hypothetical protein
MSAAIIFTVFSWGSPAEKDESRENTMSEKVEQKGIVLLFHEIYVIFIRKFLFCGGF